MFVCVCACLCFQGTLVKMAPPILTPTFQSSAKSHFSSTRTQQGIWWQKVGPPSPPPKQNPLMFCVSLVFFILLEEPRPHADIAGGHRDGGAVPGGSPRCTGGPWSHRLLQREPSPKRAGLVGSSLKVKTVTQMRAGGVFSVSWLPSLGVGSNGIRGEAIRVDGCVFPHSVAGCDQ